MSASEHTPGPWVPVVRVPYVIGQSRSWQVVGRHGEPVADISSYRSDPEADARLIAAAPDMRRIVEMLAYVDELQIEELKYIGELSRKVLGKTGWQSGPI